MSILIIKLIIIIMFTHPQEIAIHLCKDYVFKALGKY